MAVPPHLPENIEEEIALMNGLGILFPPLLMNARDRELRNEELRRRLRQEGLEFCDDASNANDASKRGWFGKRRSADDDLQPEQESRPFHLGAELGIVGIAASTTDHETQSIAETLADNGERFWSSRGSSSQADNESLTYQVLGPCSRVHAVEIVVYRATYQFGFPIYPPKEVSFSVGMHPSNMTHLRRRYPVQPTPEPQLFTLPKEAPPCRFLQVHLIGKQQRQREDRLYYHAIRRVRLLGEGLSATAMRDLGEQQLLPQRSGLAPLLGTQQSMWSVKASAPQPEWVAPGESHCNLDFISYGQSYHPWAAIAASEAELDRPWQATALEEDPEEGLLEM